MYMYYRKIYLVKVSINLFIFIYEDCMFHKGAGYKETEL